jgi:glycosyltransferase involved in cell wall biosynthesis
MASSDVLVFPATVGHFARPVIESGFMKKPVIASNLPPLEELVVDGKTGFLVDPNDIDMWVEKLLLLLQNKKIADDFGQNAYKNCTQKFDLACSAKQIQEIYNQLMLVPRPK